jgi:dGTPase
MLTRAQLELNESRSLATYAIKSKDSHGRKYPEEEPDYRTCFQRDRDRIIHTTAFRRLEYKTQVFINYEGDYYRTRLTHTLEVTQIGRTIARALGGNEDLVEAICLAHDLGHPPFGHSGETSLARLMKNFGGFDHNRQSLRILTQLEKRYQDFNGLNLTWEVLEGIVKHESEYDLSDSKDYNPHLRASLEAQIANVADELAYTAHDLDDGLHSQMITPVLLGKIELWENLIIQVRWHNTELDELNRHEIIRQLIGMEVTDIVENSSRMIKESGCKTVADIQELAYNIVSFSEEVHRKNRQLKDFLFKFLYQHYRVKRMAVKADRILNDLFNAYNSETNILPDHIENLMGVFGKERTICDYIAGMTDRFAIDEHRRLFDPTLLP